MKLQCRSGDSLWYYSQLFDVPLALLEDANKEISHRKLHIGDSLLIPGYYLERVNDQNQTLVEIAEHYQIALDSILLLNQETESNPLDGLYIPKRVDKKRVQSNSNTLYDYNVFKKDLQQLQELYPFIKTHSIGTSLEGRPIIEMNIGRGRKKIHFNGAFHANEWITTSVMMRFVNDYLLALTNQSQLGGLSMEPFYEQVSLSIVPMVNPDGVQLVIQGLSDNSPFSEDVLRMNNGSMDFSQWKANIRGVDLNNQFPADWDIESKRKPQSPSSRDFPGYSPLSEPESQAMAELTKRSQFDQVIAFHTQGKEIYWGYEGFEPSHSEAIVKEYEKVSRYKAVQYLDSYAGFKDWFIQDFRRPGFTVELGEGTNPLPLSQLDEIYRDSLGIFLASLYM